MSTKNDESINIEPTRSELEILQVLWQNGPSTVRFVNDTLNAQKRSVQYTSTLKLMQIMTEKKMLKRDESNMKHIIFLLLRSKRPRAFYWTVLFDSMFNGSASSLMMQLLGNKKTSKEELAEIKELLKKA
jgi:predicted transcriptional regulator